MNRVKELTKEIQEYLDEIEYTLKTSHTRYGNIDLYSEITCNIDTIIDIDEVEDASDRWWQATTYIMANKVKWYSLILSSSVERTQCDTAEEFAEYIYELEQEAKSLTLTIK